jgi:hypothetical protein
MPCWEWGAGAETTPLWQLTGTAEQGIIHTNTVPAAAGQETFALGGGSGMTGVIALTQGGILTVNGVTRAVSGPFLKGQLGSEGGGLFDVAITPNASTALISNFGDSRVNFISLLNPQAPVFLGRVNIGFFAEDIAITGDGKWALVTDGGFTSRIAVVNIATRRIASVFNFTDEYFNVPCLQTGRPSWEQITSKRNQCPQDESRLVA